MKTHHFVLVILSFFHLSYIVPTCMRGISPRSFVFPGAFGTFFTYISNYFVSRSKTETPFTFLFDPKTVILHYLLENRWKNMTLDKKCKNLHSCFKIWVCLYVDYLSYRNLAAHIQYDRLEFCSEPLLSPLCCCGT